MIHRALFGSVERFFAVLTEHYGGAFPAWLAPVQVLARARWPSRSSRYLDDVVRAAAGAGDPGRGGPLRRPDAEEDPQRAARRRCRSCSSPGARTPRPGAVSFRYRDGRAGQRRARSAEAIERIVARRVRDRVQV